MSGANAHCPLRGALSASGFGLRVFTPACLCLLRRPRRDSHLLPSWQFSFSYPPLFGPGNCGLWWVPTSASQLVYSCCRAEWSPLHTRYYLNGYTQPPWGAISVVPHYPSWLFHGMCTTSVRNQSPSWWDSKLKITWARDTVRPVVPCRPTRGRFGPPDRNLVGVIKCAFQSAMCGGDRVVRVPPASSVNVRCQFGNGGG